MVKNKSLIVGIILIILLITYTLVVYFKTPKLYSKTFLAAGTFVTVSSPDRTASAVVREVFSKYEKLLNIYDSNSELSLINSNAFAGEVKLSDDMYEFLSLAQSAYKVSDGAFDVSIGRLVKLWKDRIKDDKVEFPDKDLIVKVQEGIGFDKVLLEEKQKTVRFKSDRLTLDPGGIAKGFIVDKAVSELRDQGVDSAIINAGGDVYCLGTKFGKAWRVGLNDPLMGGILDAYEIVDQAVATSGNYEQYFMHENKRYSHIIDPQSGYPVSNNILSVTVIAHNLTTADIFATSFMVMGVEKTREYLAKTRSNMKVFMIELVDGNKKLHLLGDIN